MVADQPVQPPDSLPQPGVKMVLDAVVGASRQPLSNEGPFVADFLVEVEEGGFLRGRPVVSDDAGVEVVVVALPALFSSASWHPELFLHAPCDVTPLLLPALFSQIPQDMVFLLAPDLPLRHLRLILCTVCCRFNKTPNPTFSTSVDILGSAPQDTHGPLKATQSLKSSGRRYRKLEVY